MKTKADRLPSFVLTGAALTLAAVAAWSSSALADGSPTVPTKGPEVITVGAVPYTGPLPEELAKLARVEATLPAATAQVKEPATATMTTTGRNTLTAAEQARLTALLAIQANAPALPLPVMPKLGPMDVPKDGIPELTAQEREKHAREQSTPGTTPAGSGSAR